MKIDDKILIIMMMVILLLLCGFHTVGISQRPTRAEVKAMIKADTTSIFHINNAGQLQSCLYTLILIELNEIEGIELRQKLENHVKWMVAMEEQRQAMALDKFEGEE